MCVQAMSRLPASETWLGKTFDLVGAYRQCAIKPSSQRFAHIVVQEPGTSKLYAFRMRALPFGSIRSVHSFLRVSHSLWYILVKEFWLLTTNYFDDFVSIATATEASAVQACMHMFFKMLGWRFAESGDKAPDFAQVFQALGVTVNVSAMESKLVTIGNTESRRLELMKSVDEVLQNKRLSKIEALRLRGRLQFAAGNVLGRIAKSALATITAHAYFGNSAQLGDNACLALRLHRHLLDDGRPRELRWACCHVWFIQTDSCYEQLGDQAFSGIGVVLFDPSGKPVRFFSERLNDQILLDLNPSKKMTVIFECEFFALLCAIMAWSRLMSGSTVFYTDNNAVRDCLISCSTGNFVAKRMLIAVFALECLEQFTPWYAPVPTGSHMADAPSRLNVEPMLQLGVVQDKLDVSNLWARHLALAATWGEEQAQRQAHR